MIASYPHFTIREEFQPEGKTSKYRLVSHSRGTIYLGIIAWYVPWRQFCFFPEPDTVWSDGCLADVQSFLEDLKLKAKALRVKEE